VAPVANLKIIPPVLRGGTGSTSAAAAAAQLSLVTSASLGVNSGVAQAAGDGKLPLSAMPALVITGVTLEGPTEIFQGQTVTYTITNYDAMATYAISATGGRISRSGAVVTYIAPAGVQSATLTINGRALNLTVRATAPLTPSITSPVLNSSNVSSSATVTSSVFALSTGVGTHLSSDWQLSTDESFTTIVAASYNDTVNRTSWPINLSLENTRYFVRVRYKGDVVGDSSWSAAGSFVTKPEFLFFTEEAKITASDRAPDDAFGVHACLDSTGTRLVVGALLADVSGVVNSGAAYVFVRSGGTWTQESKLVASDRAASDQMGLKVAIDDAGTRVVVGSHAADVGGVSDTGAAYVYVRSGTTWTQEAKLTASDRAIGDLFGIFVEFDSTATRLVVGANLGNSPTANTGAIYIYTRSGTTWTQEVKLLSSDAAEGDNFGYAVSIDSTATRVAAGAFLADASGVLTNTGAVYIFTT
jgi:hypothetical protein